MSAKQGNNRDKLRKICVYGVFSAVCITLGFLESLLPLDFIAPGVKIGLANSVCMLLAIKGDIKGAFAVNTVRILLSNLLFGSALSLAFSLSAGLVSLLGVCLLRKVNGISFVGISILAAVIHNLVQTAVAVIITGAGAVYYLPVLLLSGTLSGIVTGMLCNIIFKKVKTNANK